MHNKHKFPTYIDSPPQNKKTHPQQKQQKLPSFLSYKDENITPAPRIFWINLQPGHHGSRNFETTSAPSWRIFLLDDPVVRITPIYKPSNLGHGWKGSHVAPKK